MPKILFILHLPPPVHGAAMVGKYIHDSKVVNEAFECRYINLTTAASLEDIGQMGFRKVRAFACLLRKIRRTVREFRPDLVYVTPNACGGAFYKDYVVVQMLKRMGCRVVVHYHNKGVRTRQDRWLDNLLYRRFFKDIKVILLAEALYQDVSKYVDHRDVFICPNGIPETVGAEPVAERHNAIPHILFLSNLIVSKGVLVLLDALKILKERGYSFVCDFVGGETAEIDARRFEREVKERGLNELAIYHGRKYGEQKEQFFAMADLFVFPTYYPNECFPLVLLEAMQHGLSCISTDEGGIPGIIEDGQTGYIVERQNAVQLADRMERLMTDRSLRKQFGVAGRRKYETENTLPVFESRIVEILNQSL